MSSVAVAGLATLLWGCDPAPVGGGLHDDPSRFDEGWGGSKPAPEPESPPLPESTSGPIDVGPMVCEERSLEVTATPADVVLVLDKSRSMVSNRWDHDGDPGTPTVTRWASLYDVVDGVVADFDEDIRLGAVLFPAGDVRGLEPEEACRVDEEPSAPVSSRGGQWVLDAMPDREDTDIWGGTPTAQGLWTAIDHLLEIREDRPQAIVLVTDGAANCGEGSDPFGRYDDRLPEIAADAYATGITVHVVGIDILDELLDVPAVNPLEKLTAIARAGGAALEGPIPFFNATDENELSAALSEIAGGLGCTIPIGLEGSERRLRLELDGEALPFDPTCDGGIGWRSAPGGDGLRVELCEASCVEVRQRGILDARMACVPEP